MPVGNWKRFKLAFFTTRSEQAAAWTDIAERTLRMVRDATTALKEVSAHAERADAILHRLRVLDKVVATAKKTYSETADDSVKTAQVEILNTTNTEGEALLVEVQGKLREQGAATIAGLPGGNKVLDDMLSEIDWSANRDVDEAFGLDALKARFQLDMIQGKLGHVALPKLYDILSKLPDSHTRTNDMFKRVTRDASTRQVGGCYRLRDHEVVIVNKHSVGSMGDSHKLDADDEVADEHKPKAISVKTFSHVTLHEVGHAYDHSVGFMASHMGQADYGNWRNVSKEQLVQIWGTEKGFFTDADFDELPEEFLLEYLQLELKHADSGVSAQAAWQVRADRAALAPDAGAIAAQPQVAEAAALYARYEDSSNTDDVWPEDENDRRVIARRLCMAFNKAIRSFSCEMAEKVAWGMVGEPTISAILVDRVAPHVAIAQCVQAVAVYGQGTPPWSSLRKHEAAKVMRAFGSSRVGFWKLGAQAAAEYSIGGTVYTVDSGGGYYSYDAAARAFSVSKYQWHAPAEWFAELYAFYFAGRLKDTAKHVELFLKDLGEPLVV